MQHVDCTEQVNTAWINEMLLRAMGLREHFILWNQCIELGISAYTAEKQAEAYNGKA